MDGHFECELRLVKFARVIFTNCKRNANFPQMDVRVESVGNGYLAHIREYIYIYNFVLLFLISPGLDTHADLPISV